MLTIIHSRAKPEFKQVNEALTEHLASITDRIIKDSVFSDVGEAEEKAESLALTGTG